MLEKDLIINIDSTYGGFKGVLVGIIVSLFLWFGIFSLIWWFF